MNLLEYLVAHDGHPGEGGQEEELVEVPHNSAAEFGEVTPMVLVDDK